MDYEITAVTKETSVSEGTRFLEVTVLFNGDIERKFAYPLETTAKEIEKDIKAKAKVLSEEAESAETQVEVDKAESKADKTIDSLLGTN